MEINEIKNNKKAQKEAINIIGDNKLPNKYLLVVSNHFLVNTKRGYLEDINEIKKDFKSKSKTIGFFKTFNDALKYIENFIYIEEAPKEENINSVYIEDRFSGLRYEEGIEAYKKEKDILNKNCFKYEYYTREDTKITRDIMGKKGVQFV
jgi:hypothetical protein